MSEWTGPWNAVFRNGPSRGDTRCWAVGPVWQEIHLAPHPTGREGFFICGGDGIPIGKVHEPYPGSVRYILSKTRHARYGGERMLVAYYDEDKRE